MDEQSRLKRLQKIARHERLLKQREKQQVFEKSRVGRKSSCDNDSDLPHDSDTKLNNEELNHELSSSDDDADNKMVVMFSLMVYAMILTISLNAANMVPKFSLK